MNQKAVVEAMAGFVPLFVDFNADKDAICEKYGAVAKPTLILANPDGEVLKKYEGAAEVPVLKKVLPDLARQHFRDFPWAAEPARLLEKAKEAGKPAGLYFADESEASKAFVRALNDKSLRDLTKRLLFAKAPFKKDSDLAKAHGIAKAATLVLLDPSKENSEIGRIEGKKSARDLDAFLKKALGDGK